MMGSIKMNDRKWDDEELAKFQWCLKQNIDIPCPLIEKNDSMVTFVSHMILANQVKCIKELILTLRTIDYWNNNKHIQTHVHDILVNLSNLDNKIDIKFIGVLEEIDELKKIIQETLIEYFNEST